MASSNESVQKEMKGKPEVSVTLIKATSSNFFSTGLPSSGLPTFMSNSQIQSSYIVEEKTLAEKTSPGLLTTQTSPAIFRQFEKRPQTQASAESSSPNLKK